VTGQIVAWSRPAGQATEERYTWPAATLAEGRRNLRGLKRKGHRAELVRSDGKVES
jgi:hypothetical protein